MFSKRTLMAPTKILPCRTRLTSALTKGSDPKNPTDTFQFHPNALSVISPHGFSFVLVQACVAILILVGFESVTSMGEEAKNAKRDIPRAVLLSLAHSGRILLPLRVFWSELFPEQRLHDDDRLWRHPRPSAT